MEYLKDGTFDTKFLVTHRVKLEDFPALYAAFDKRHAGGESIISFFLSNCQLTLISEQGLCRDFHQVSSDRDLCERQGRRLTVQ